MAHREQQEFCLYVRDKFTSKFYKPAVLDVGSLDINGNNRYLFLEPKYTGIDIGEGKNVDIVCKGHEYKPNEKYDIVISTECFEHDMHYEATIKNCIQLTKDNGLFMFSCASTGRPEHGTARTTPQDSPFSHIQFSDYYKNLTESDIRSFLNVEEIFSEFQFIYLPITCDLYFYGIKKPVLIETPKIEVDVCIISYAKTHELKQVTEKGIESLLQSEESIKFNIFVMESNCDVDYSNYPNTRTFYSHKPFNYNEYLNKAREQGNSKYIALCNSDLTYEKNWASNIIQLMTLKPEIMSASPFCPQTQQKYEWSNDVYFGYEVRKHLAGWCIFQQRKIYDIIGKLNEDVEFWYSDNIYAEQLKSKGLLHVLVTKSIVNHHSDNLGITGTLTKSPEERSLLTVGQYSKYVKACENLI